MRPARGSNAALEQLSEVKFNFTKDKKTIFLQSFLYYFATYKKYLLNVKNIIVSKTLKAFLLLFCGPPTQDMGLMRPAISKIGHMRPPSQFEFVTPAIDKDLLIF